MKLKRAVLIRTSSDDQGTFGLLRSEGFSVYISELPWRDNLKQLSCIPAGTYTCKWVKSPKFGWCYQLLNVPNRGNILIHRGNYVGSTDKGYKTNSHGCLLPATILGVLSGQKAGLMSLPATNKLYSFFNKEDFELEIINAYNTNGTSVQ